jgi:hypothetical protein
VGEPVAFHASIAAPDKPIRFIWHAHIPQKVNKPSSGIENIIIKCVARTQKETFTPFDRRPPAAGVRCLREIDSMHARKASNYIVMMETHTSVVCVYCQNLQLIGARIAQSTLGRGEKICWP